MEKQEMRRLYEIIAYKEYFIDLQYNVEQLKNCRWYWSYHDKDLKDDGTLKDPHYHILVYFDNACTLSALMKKLNFEKKEKIKYYKKGSDEGRLDYRVRYLIHFKNKDPFKFEYSLDCIHSNDENLDRFFTDDDNKQNSDITMLFDYFDSREDKLISYRNFLNYVFQSNLWGTYRKNAVIFNRLLDEHNESIKTEALKIFGNYV